MGKANGLSRLEPHARVHLLGSQETLKRYMDFLHPAYSTSSLIFQIKDPGYIDTGNLTQCGRTDYLRGTDRNRSSPCSHKAMSSPF